MNQNKWLWLISLWAAPALLIAQTTAQIPAPRTPILERAPSRAEWTITYQYGHQKSNADAAKGAPGEKANTTKAPAPLRPTESQVSKDGKTYREITTWSDGHKSEKWIVHDLEVQDNIQGTVSRIMPPGAFYVPNYSDYSHSDFEDVQWVSMNNYVGPSNLNGATVYNFQVAADKRALTPREKLEHESRDYVANKTEAAQTYTAYLDIRTQLPIYLDNGEFIRTYTYPANVSGKLVPPPKFAQALEAWQSEIKRKTVAPPPL